MNSFRNKITDLGVIMKTLSINYLILSENKIYESFPTSQFNFEGYEIRARRNRDKYGGGLIEFVWRRVLCKCLRECGTKYSECLCSELTFTKKWISFSIYRPPESSNLSTFFEELKTSLSKAVRNMKNLFVVGDFNIDMKNKIISLMKFAAYLISKIW